ncbi:MAG: YkvA family protein [Fulvivirga sp.]|nr:YkvA family protein [Fulvivirga sp.]
MDKEKKERIAEKIHEITQPEVIESKVFSVAMNVAEKYASSKRKVFRILQHAFEKLKEESARNHLKAEFKEQVSVLVRLVKAYYHGVYRKVPVNAILRIIGGLIYFVWILDLIPDFIPILGLADDIAVIVWVYSGLKEELEEFEQWESVMAYELENEN